MSRNKNKFNKFIEVLKEQEGIEIYDIDFLEDYYGEEKDKIMHFKIKGLKNWLWGAWIINTESGSINYKIQVFCQYERFVDKFKPSRGYFCVDVLPFFEYYTNEEKVLSLDVWELGRVVRYIKKHEAMAFCYENDITAYKGELWAKYYMLNCIMGDILYQWTKKVAHKSLHMLSAIFSFFHCIKVAYCPDQWNEDSRINDSWVVYYQNKLGKYIAETMKNLVKRKLIGSVYINKEEDEFMWDIYCMAANRKDYPLTKSIENEDGTIEVDDDELWAIVNQMEYDDIIQLYGKL